MMNCERYCKIDVVDISKLDSSLTAKDYFVFYAMLSGIYSQELVNRFNDLLVQLELQHITNACLSTLSKVERIIVRCLASYLKNTDCFLGVDLLTGMNKLEQKKLIDFLQFFLVEQGCICLLLESESVQMCEMALETVSASEENWQDIYK